MPEGRIFKSHFHVNVAAVLGYRAWLQPSVIIWLVWNAGFGIRMMSDVLAFNTRKYRI